MDRCIAPPCILLESQTNARAGGRLPGREEGGCQVPARRSPLVNHVASSRSRHRGARARRPGQSGRPSGASALFRPGARATRRVEVVITAQVSTRSQQPKTQFAKILSFWSTPPVAIMQRICTLAVDFSAVPLRVGVPPASLCCSPPGTPMLSLTIPGAHLRQVMNRSCISPSNLTHLPRWLRSQHLSVLSSDAESRFLPPGWKTIARTQLSWPTSVMMQVPRALQSLVVLSREPVAMNSAVLLAGGGFFDPAIVVGYWYEEGGASAQHSIECSCPNMVSFDSGSNADMSHSLTAVSSPAEYEADGAHAMVVACQGSDVQVIVCRVPPLDGQIRAAGCDKTTASWATIVDIKHCSCVALYGLLQLS
ncbi:hypothetical protein ACJZ2D_009928 [Fusarium nematophilum]